MNKNISFLASKAQDEISREWDEIARERDSDITARTDVSFTQVLEPWVLNRVKGAETVVDVGCGSGRLTAKLSTSTNQVIGVDPSAASVEIAKTHDDASEYFVAMFEEFVRNNSNFRANLVVANMVLMDVLDLEGICEAIADVAPGGRIIATITHPAFWPIYWGYADKEGFNYSNEIVVEGPFKTSSHEFRKMSTHVHRPLEKYLQVFRMHGIRITDLRELRGPESVASFAFPRFLGIEALIE